MQIAEFEVRRLFGTYDHQIRFPIVGEATPGSSLAILHGPNGIGKTTVLRMIASFLEPSGEKGRSFEVFRRVPFESAKLTLSEDVPPLTLRSDSVNGSPVIRFGFGSDEAILTGAPGKSGGIDSGQQDISDRILESLTLATSEIRFDFIETARIFGQGRDERDDAAGVSGTSRSRITARAVREDTHPAPELARRMARFIADAQVNYRDFFVRSGPDLYQRIVERLASPEPESATVGELLTRLKRIEGQDREYQRLGIIPERWNYEELRDTLVNATSAAAEERRLNALSVTAQYVDVLEARMEQRSLIAERLLTFERLVAEFFTGKSVRVAPREGLHIESENGTILSENQLSSGERHFLYLMISAVLTRSLGTVIAIDEPEMSMHVAWQRKLVRALLECSAGAQPQLVLATHSVEIAAGHAESLIELGR